MSQVLRTVMFAIAYTALAGAGPSAGSPTGRDSDFAAESAAYAEKLVEKGWPDLAIIVYEDILARAPKHPQTHDVCFKLGRLNFKREAFKKSADNFHQFLAQAPRGKRRVDALYWAAESHYAAHQYNDALKAFKQCMNECPDPRDEKYVHSSYGAGWCHYKLKQYEQAVGYLTPFTDKYFYYDLAPEAQIALGRAYAAMKKYDDACKALALVIENSVSPEQQAQAYLATGRARFDEGRYVEARTSFDNLLKKLPESKLAPAAMWWKANVIKRFGQNKRASDVFAELARKYPRSEYGRKAVVELGAHLSSLPPDEVKNQVLHEEQLFGLAEAAYREGRFGRALEFYGKLLESYPKCSRAAPAQFKMGMCLMRINKLGEAKDRFLKMRAQFPQDELAGQAAYRAGNCAYQLGQYDQARELIEKVIAAGPSRDIAAHARFLLGECLFQSRAYANAAKNYQEALATAGSSEIAQEVQFRLGLALYHAKDFERAAAAFKEFRAKFDKSAHAPRALYLEADSLLRNRKQAEAEDLLKTYVKRHPKDKSCADALYQLGRLAERAGRFDDALKHYSRMRELNAAPGNGPSDGKAEERICWVLYRTGGEKGAVKAFLNLMQRWPDRKLHPETCNWVGVSLLRAGRHRDAELVFERLITHWGADESASALVQQAYYYKAQCHGATGDKRAQLQTLQMLVKRFPKSRFEPAAKLIIADVCSERGLPDQAAALYREVVHSSTGLLYAEASCKLGLAMVQQQHYAKASKLLARVVVLFDAPKTRVWALKARLGLGQCCEAQGRWQAALKHYQDVVEAKGDAGPIAEIKREAAARLLQCDGRKRTQGSGKEAR